MGAQPSTARCGGTTLGSESPLRNCSLSSLKAASFSPSPEPIDASSPRRTPPWVQPLHQAYGSHAASSSGDLEAGIAKPEVISPSGQHSIRVEVDTPSSMVEPIVRQPSKMSVASFGSIEEVSTPSVASRPSSRPTSAWSEASQSGRGFARSRSASVTGSRPASASSKMGFTKVPPRDPALVQAEKLAKLSLEKLAQEDFITARQAWGISTPSTASPMSMSYAASSQASTTSGSRPTSSATSVSSNVQADDPLVKLQLKEARQRAKASFEKLGSELRGSAGATPARYSTWPTGCAVKIALEDVSSMCAGAVNDAESTGLIASVVSYDKALNTFTVKFDDGSTRSVPAQRVTRARARDRNNLQGKSPGGASPDETVCQGAKLVEPERAPRPSTKPESKTLGRAQLAEW